MLSLRPSQNKQFYTMKQTLRNQLQQRRRNLSPKQQKEKSQKTASNLAQSNIFKKASRIAFYLAVNAEADPSSLRNSKTKSSSQFYLPVLAKNKNQGLLFAPLNDDSEFEANQFSIPEPICPADELVKAEQLDLIVMPLLGFDKRGNRLGMGGGFYDRSLAFKNEQNPAPTKPVLAGFAYACQEIDELDSESWDVKLDYIVTEEGIITTKDI